MTSKIHCFLSAKQAYPELEEFVKTHDKISLYYPKNEDELKSQLPLSISPQLLLFDPKSMALANIDFINEINTKSNFIIALVSPEDQNDINIKYFQLNPQIGHLIPSKNKSISEEMQKLLMIVNAAEAVDGLQMTVDKVLSSLKNKQTFELTESQARWHCYEEISNYAEKLHVFPEFKNIIKTAASELLTNAFYDAPKNPETGKSLNPNRKSKVCLVPPKKVEFHFGLSPDDAYLWMFVRDPFGSLDKPTLVASLLRAATERTAKLDQEGGAGLGLKMVYEWASEVVFGLAQGESTLVGCKFRITRRNRILIQNWQVYIFV